MSTLTPIRARHQNLARQVADSFGVDLEDALNGIRRSYGELRYFLGGDGPAHVYVFHQPREGAAAAVGAGGGSGEPGSATTTSSLSSRGGHASKPAAAAAAVAELFFSVGGDVRLQPGHKTVYFLRATDGPVDLDKGSDGSLLYGELSADALGSLATTLRALYAPHLADRSPAEWGRVEERTRAEFCDDVAAVTGVLVESMGARACGVDLAAPHAELQLEAVLRAAQPKLNGRKGALDADTVDQLQKLLETWCGQVESFVKGVEASEALLLGPGGGGGGGSEATPGSSARRGSSSQAGGAAGDPHAGGPQAVLTYWRTRSRRLACAVEQLQHADGGDVRSVVQLLTAVTTGPPEKVPTSLFNALRRWKELEMRVGEASNEAADTVRSLASLDKFMPPLYAPEPHPDAVGDVLPALMSSMQLVHDIARYFATPERMSDLFAKLTCQMISVCRAHILRDAPEGSGGGSNASLPLWKMEPDALIPRLEAALRLHELYQQTYRLTREMAAASAVAVAAAAPSATAAAAPSPAAHLCPARGLNTNLGRPFDFAESAIFGRLGAFCRRVKKLIDLFATMRSYRVLAAHRLEGLEPVISDFHRLLADFQARRHDLLAFTSGDFDRDFVELTVAIDGLEVRMQDFIHAAFERVPSVALALDALARFGRVFEGELFASILADKAQRVFAAFGRELEAVTAEYAEHKHAPPKPRNLPPVSGCISWARHLLLRIEGPMRRFERWPHVYAPDNRDGRRIVKSFNRTARVLVAYELLWLQAWCESVEGAKAGLQAPLLVRRPEDGRLLVNFDGEILQLLREAKCLVRLGMELPESVQAVLRQEGALKATHADLLHLLRHYYGGVVARVTPVLHPLLAPAIADVEYRLRSGLTSLTWTSLNLEAYRTHVADGVARLEALVRNVNDVVENRIEPNLRAVARTLLVYLPCDGSFTLDEFVATQQEYVGAQAAALQAKNVEVEGAVFDLLQLVREHAVDPHVSPAAEADGRKLVEHYNYFMYTALLMCAKASLNALKQRVAVRGGGGSCAAAAAAGGPPAGSGGSGDRPFFELDVTLAACEPYIRLAPALEDVQAAINRCATAVLGCFKDLFDWGQEDLPEDARETFFSRVTRDLEVVRVVLLLTGSVQATRKEVNACLASFEPFRWLWASDPDAVYREWAHSAPSIEDFDQQLRRFAGMEDDIAGAAGVFSVGALSLSTGSIKGQLKGLNGTWRAVYSDNLHRAAAGELAGLTDYLKTTLAKLHRAPDSIDSIGYLMDLLGEVRRKEAAIEGLIAPIVDRYALLDAHLPEGFMVKDEMDNKAMLRVNWARLRDRAGAVSDTIASLQAGFRKRLLGDVKAFRGDVAAFRDEYTRCGPMVRGIAPDVAMERLRRCEEEFDIRARKRELFCNGEALFALPRTEYPELDVIAKELGLLGKLYGLYRDVMARMAEWRVILWADTVANIGAMSGEMEGFASRCRKMPKRLREWEAFGALKKQIEDFQLVLPLLQALSRPSIQPRHWEAMERITGCALPVGDTSEFRLATLLAAPLVERLDDITEVCDGADKELGISRKLDELEDKWAVARFVFANWKGRGVPVLQGVGLVVEELEEAQMNLQTLLTMRHIAFFRERAAGKLQELSDTCETLELWQKVQLLWCSLESVFLGGDIAKQMPVVAKRFQKIDKDYVNIMARASEQAVVLGACANELLRLSLPAMFEELEKCQKSLEGYLEQKRNKFPRFYFVSNPVLLQILSQGSDPLAVQQYYEKIFDSISYVEHDKRDKFSILGMVSREGRAEERIAFRKPVRVAGNIEDWLMDVLREMQATMKVRCEEAAGEALAASGDLGQLRGFVDGACGQYALLGLQLLWTADCEAALGACKRDKNALKLSAKKALDVLSVLSSWCLQDLGSKMNRTKIETLVTIQMHQRDVINDIYGLFRAKKIAGADDFEWLKQARFYWEPEGRDFLDDNGCCRVRITDVPFEYQYEYLGCKERLVITPLTDRCFITLAQALGMYFGGAPAGPAGTGKTETVKDMGRSLGIFVVVTNCTDQMRYTDCGKIFKGLCMAGLWGCFDEFNRITLPVLSVVAQQVLAINNAKKAGVEMFQFPGDPQQVKLEPACGFFITMNPGYAGRQELPENLKALFRGVAMMVPDREIIMRVKLCSVGYTNFNPLARKFFICYQLAEQQLSKQKHYDFGLRNILSVLRTAGATKRENVDADEEMLLYRTLRDMNLSKLVAQDVPLFLSMLADLFPSCAAPPKREYPAIEAAIRAVVAESKLVCHPTWLAKVIQLHETCLVRHGIMLTGPAGGGKSRIIETLQAALVAVEGRQYKTVRLNPKAVQAHELYGQTDPLSGEWVKGVFAAIWEKYNNRDLPYTTWIVEDGPVDAIWIEDLNTVLDDNRLLTLASGDRIPMTDNVKIMFENESLANASPATVSRAGIIYISETDLDWKPVADAWVSSRPAEQQAVLRALFAKLVGDNTPTEVGHAFDFVARQCHQVMPTSRVGVVTGLYHLLGVLLDRSADVLAPLAAAAAASASSSAVDPLSSKFGGRLERLFVFCMAWSVGGLLEPEDRVRFDGYLRKIASPDAMPPSSVAGGGGGEDGAVGSASTIYDCVLDDRSLEWRPWRAPAWRYPEGDKLDFANLLVPTMDSTRAIYLLEALHAHRKPVLLLGGPGTAKTSTAMMFFASFDAAKRLLKRVNFSSATTPGMLQESVESELDKRGGKSFGPPNGKRMTVFIDDVSMPAINAWGDQPTNEIVRQMVEMSGVYFLDKDKRGDFKAFEDLQFVAAMNHPGGGRNDIPNRLKRHFFAFNMVLPSLASIDDLYGQMLRGRFTGADFAGACVATASKLTAATIELWRRVKGKMLPTPAKFHYTFNMRELSRVFQGVLLTPKDSVRLGGSQAAGAPGGPPTGVPDRDQPLALLRLWKHECARVFADKLTTHGDKEWFGATLETVVEASFGRELAAALAPEHFFVDFFREDVFDEDDVLVALAPKVYESGGSLECVRARVAGFMAKHNDEFPSRKLELVLFEDALRHLIRISRILAMPRGSALLVGVGGSGKQSLARLAAYIARSKLFQITLTKTYGVNSLKDDLKAVFEYAGRQRKSVTFLLTDAEIKDEAFLEYINSVLMTGEVAGLFAKDEMMAMTADLQAAFLRERPGLPDTPDNLKQFFIDCVRDNLHLVLCMSPVNAKFAERARKFPGIVSGTTIDWFLPWPAEALISVSRGVLSDFKLEAEPQQREALIQHIGAVHGMVVDVCDEYYAATRRRVYQTPKSYLSFLTNYCALYTRKLEVNTRKEANVNRGLEKLIQGAADVEAMKLVLASEQVKLARATEDTVKLLASLQVRQAEAEAESAKVAVIRADCEAEAARISTEKHACEADLAKAQPIVDRALRAVNSIKAADINEVKNLKKPADIIRSIFDTVILLFMKPLTPLAVAEVNIKKRQFEFIAPSWDVAKGVMSDDFLKRLQTFNKDAVNEETVELMKPYTELDEFDPEVAKLASNAAEGLCTWCRAMGDYFYASKIIRPKLEALAIAQAQLEAAQAALEAASAREAAVVAVLTGLKADFDAQLAEKRRIEDGAAQLQRKMEQASALIGGLAGERGRWGEDAKMFADIRRRLLGDCAVACAFVSYCGPFNQPFRAYMVADKFVADCRRRGVPVSADPDVISFLVDVGTIGDWNLQGLPTDPLSIQNGIMVTRCARWPLLVDPQGQALAWLKAKEAARLPKEPVCALNSPKLKDALEFALSEGRALIIVGVEEELDPLLDPVLEKQFVVKGRKRFVKLADTEVEVHDAFALFFISRLPNPHFSPELQAKTTVVDFTVTQKGLEEQLLGRVIAREQNALEKLLTQVLADANANTKALLDLDAQLLDRLSSNSGNLLDDEQLLDVLANTKAKAAEVKEKLADADETKRSISEKREQFRPVATRGSVLYFSIVELSQVNCMYQTSLAQFIDLFGRSMEVAERAGLPSKRVANIIDAQTYLVYRYVNKGLYERDKLLYVFICAVRMLTTGGLLDPAEVGLFLRGGAALDAAAVRGKKPAWLPADAWLNVAALAEAVPLFRALPESLVRNEGAWRRWFDDNEPEKLPIPELEAALRDAARDTGPWRRLLLLRCLRVDRALLCIRAFVRETDGLGERYVAPVTDTIEAIYDEMAPCAPVVFLLSTGADPTDSIEQLAKKKKTGVACVSMGEGQEPVAVKAITAGAVNGSWVLLQNSELGLDLMEKLEDMLVRMREGGGVHPDFRLFITALPHPKFPLGLLQMSTKVTNEPPAGLRAGLLRSYNTIVDQDRLERIDSGVWRQLVYGLCFLHSVAQERRKFGPLGWSISYEYATNDLSACLMFLERHLYSAGGGGTSGGGGGGTGGAAATAAASASSSALAISWPTVQYMVSEVQYGGKVTDDLDRRLFNTYAAAWVSPRVLEPAFAYNPAAPLARVPGDFRYSVPDAPDVEGYRRFIGGMPEVDTPEMFGLHPNADLTFRVKEASAFLGTMGDTQPQGGGSGGGGGGGGGGAPAAKSLDEVVADKAGELLARMPDDYAEEDVKARIKRLGGMGEPLNIFLYQEVQRLQAVLGAVRAQLQQMQLAIRGEVVMTGELLAAMGDLFVGRVPRSWLVTPGGDEFSWLLPSLGAWYASLLERDAQLRSWLGGGRPTSFWLTGFANPQGFLTAMKQEVTRLHRAQAWALDDVYYHTEVTEWDRPEQVRAPPKEGVYIHGLFADGARWDRGAGALAESEPKKLFAPLPVLHVTTVSRSLLAEKRAAQGAVYECPVYRYAARTGRYHVFTAALPVRGGGGSAEHWTLRGAAILCTV